MSAIEFESEKSSIEICPTRIKLLCQCENQVHEYQRKQIRQDEKTAALKHAIVCGRFPGFPMCGCTIPCRTARSLSFASRILDHPNTLMVGAAPVAYLLSDELYGAGIRQIVNLCQLTYPKDERFTFVDLPIEDSAHQDLSTVITRAVASIRNGHEAQPPFGTYVHCEAGVSRSVSICIAYLILQMKLPYVQSLDHMEKMHPPSNPNSGFRIQLKNLENEN